MYCAHCGTEVKENAVYCHACGYHLEALAKELAEKKAEQDRANEMVLGIKPRLVLCTEEKVGILKWKLCYMSFYTDKIVLAYLDSKRIKSEMIRLGKENNTKEMSFVNKVAYGVTFYENYKNRFYDMNKEEILTEDPSNQEIIYQAIKSFRFIPKSRVNKEGDPYAKHGEIVIKTTYGKHKFIHKYDDAKDEIKVNLASIVGLNLK